MAKAPTTTTTPATELPYKVALHRITYGASQVAVPNSLFRPTTQEELDELVRLEAVRDPTAEELAVLDPAPVSSSASSPSNVTGDENPLG